MRESERERNSSRENITSEGDDRGGISGKKVKGEGEEFGLQPDLAESCWCKALV